nr:cell division protein ZapE [Rhodothalassium salexigens]
MYSATAPRTSAPEEPGPMAAYRALVAAGDLHPDPAQEQVARRLERLYRAIDSYPAPRRRTLDQKIWRRLTFLARKTSAPRGLYLWGGVGRGKSMLMDLMFETAPTPHKRRVHFHEFMAEVHDRMTRWRRLSPKERAQLAGTTEDDPIPPVAHQIAQDLCLLCFDEMQVNDVADAMILGRLFEELLDRGVVMVITSNRPPDDLYQDGLNRQLFLPAIDLLKERLDVETLNGPTDYRLNRLSGLNTYLYPLTDANTDTMRHAFFRMTDRSIDDAEQVPTETLTVQGREVFVPKSARGVAVFSFKRLCANPLGAADYLAIARRFHTVFIVGIPVMGPEKRNEAKRFVTLIDALYDQSVKLFALAEAPPQELYPQGDGTFEFERTVSRLMAMQSQAYLRCGHGGVDPDD